MPLLLSSVASFFFLLQTGAWSSLESSLMENRIYANMFTEIIFTIHSGLATANLEIITDVNQILNTSALQGCSDYLQVLNPILSLSLSLSFSAFKRGPVTRA